MSTSVSDNNTYTEICRLAATTEEYFFKFKTDSRYTDILEHVTREEGQEYFDNTVSELQQDITKFSINDKIGSPRTYQYSFGTFSPTTLRYIKILGDLSQLKLNSKEIVEIGCGYGGQYVALRQLFTPKKYTFVDLKEPLMLLKKYISYLKLDDIQLDFIEVKDIKKIDSDLAISNYAFSECNEDIQDEYIQSILNNAKHGYMIYNNMRGYTHEEFCAKINKKVKIFKEIPNTHYKNVLLTW